MAQVKFDNRNPVFFNTLRLRVNSYFKDNNLKQTGNSLLYSKTAILLTALAFCYIFLVFFTPESIILSLLVCAFMGLLMAAIGFNVLHDGAHGSYSGNRVVNTMMAATLNMLGGSAFIWKQKHNINHHSYTNIEGMDDDIDIKPFIRVNTSQKRYWFHRFQHVYGFILYGFTYLFWIFFNDFKKYFSHKVSVESDMRRMNVREHFSFWITKVAYVAGALVLPAYNVGIWGTLLGYGIAVFICGFVIALVFQLAHVHTEAEFPHPAGESKHIENEWAIHQLNTTANFATRNWFLSWFLGGLNFQVDHHLFPKISHVHYPAISKIVRETCSEFNVKYREFPTLFSAVRSHLMYLKRIGLSS